jgi:hypothetical protein
MEIEEAVKILKYEMDELILMDEECGLDYQEGELIEAIKAVLGFYYWSLKTKEEIENE